MKVIFYFSSSSSVAGDDGTSEPTINRRQIKRRKRRKRLNTDPSSLHPERAALIEKVLFCESHLFVRERYFVENRKKKIQINFLFQMWEHK
jgi:hypothetical protein